MLRASIPPLCALCELCGEIPLSLTPLEYALPRTDESVSKQTTLIYLESTLTARRATNTKQRTSTHAESTLTPFIPASPIESTLKKRGRGVAQTLLSVPTQPTPKPIADLIAD
jgi:hypothetical protein